MNYRTILFFGATSDISKGILYYFSEHSTLLFNNSDIDWEIVLVARDETELIAIKNDINIRYQINCEYYVCDMLDFDNISKIIHTKKDSLYGIFYSAGVMYEQELLQTNLTYVIEMFNVNTVAAINIFEISSSILETKKEGFLCGISSVAGDRGRVSNYIYGSSKSAFTTYLEGLYHRLWKSNIKVLCVKPGFVDTKMTFNLKLPKKLTAAPIQVGKDIFKALKKNKSTLYTKSVWKYIMLVMIHIPTFIFKKLKF